MQAGGSSGKALSQRGRTDPVGSACGLSGDVNAVKHSSPMGMASREMRAQGTALQWRWLGLFIAGGRYAVGYLPADLLVADQEQAFQILQRLLL